MAKITGIEAWLVPSRNIQTQGRYRHLLLTECRPKWPSVKKAVIDYFKAAHYDALDHYRRLLDVTLNPLAGAARRDPARVYPHKLDASVQKGYIGEVFAGIVAENFSPHGKDGWEVPAFLFRKHNVAFEQLESYFQGGQKILKTVPGRTGDDCLAFCMEATGEISRSLYCEAKCTGDHDSGMIAEAHSKVSSSAMVSIPQLIEVLKRRPGAKAKRWVEALLRYRLKLTVKSVHRFNLVSYTCGRSPQRTTTWMDGPTPHKNYTSPRDLEAVEIHLHDVENLIKAIYAKEIWQ